MSSDASASGMKRIERKVAQMSAMTDGTHNWNANIDSLLRDADSIVGAIERESLDVYVFLKNQFGMGNVSKNLLFQFVYRSFYRLDNAGLSPDFKSRYFELMENCVNSGDVNIAELVRELYFIPISRSRTSLQFSFVTKLANSVHDDYPIYDRKVAKVFGFIEPQKKGDETSPNDRLKCYLKFYEFLGNYYRELLNTPCGKSIVKKVVATYKVSSCQSISNQKLLDFFFWSAGKIADKRD